MSGQRQECGEQFFRQLSVSRTAKFSLLAFSPLSRGDSECFEDCLRRAPAPSIQPVVKVLHLHGVRHLGMPDGHGNGGQPFSDVAYPIVCGKNGEGLGDRFVEARVLGINGTENRVNETRFQQFPVRCS